MTQNVVTPPTRDRSAPRVHPFEVAGRSTPAIIAKVIGLGLLAGGAIALTPTLIATENWAFLAILWALVLVVVAVYITGRALPAKYLLPGGLFLVLFIVYPILLTFQLSTTNYGDGTRSTKDAAITRIVGSSAVQVEGGATYNLVALTQGSTTSGPFAFGLVDTATGDAYVGTEEELQPADDATIEDDQITEVAGWTVLTRQEQNELSSAGGPLEGFVVPGPDNSVIRAQGFQAVQMRTPLVYDEESDTITNADTGVVYSVERSQSGDRSFFVDPDGNRLSNQSWQENIGLFNYERIFTDSAITDSFVSILVWTLVFATVSVGGTFLIGLLLAFTLNEPRLGGQRLYRSLLIVPYAIPGFISLMIWAGFWNRDFGLVNDLLGTNINWLGEAGWARVAVLLTNLWMGFPYMFLICTGALQSIPGDLKEAAAIDGANGFARFRAVIFPLLLVSVAPLLVASFAFNFNNFNAIQLLTEGGPFSPDNPTAGGTDILISYTYRLAFGSGGQQIGFASAVSVVLFVLTGVIAWIQFRATRVLEDVN